MCKGKVLGYEFNSEFFLTYEKAELQRSEWLDQLGEIPELATPIFRCCACGDPTQWTKDDHHWCGREGCALIFSQEGELRKEGIASGIKLQCDSEPVPA